MTHWRTTLRRLPEVKALLDLIICEFSKIKRQRFILFSVLAACLFPIPMTVLVVKDNMNFEGLFRLAVMFGHFLLLPCILSVVAAIMFFMERDNDTLKNLMTVPVSKFKLVIAKLTVLFVISVIYSIAGLGATLVGGVIAGGVNGVAAKLGLSVVLGIMTFLSTLPALIIIIYFNKNYIFSILIAFFYAVFNFIVAYRLNFISADNPIITVLPIPVILRWLISFMSKNIAELKPYVLSFPVCAIILLIIGAISIILITLAYKNQEI